MKSIYEKDISKLWFILITTIVLSIMLVGYSYSYNVDTINNINEEDISIQTVYNTGRNTCIVTNNDIYNDLEGTLKGIECKFTVMGYNNTNEDLSYKIVLENNGNSDLNSDFIKINLVNKNNSLQIGPFLGNVLDNNKFEEKIKVNKNSKIYDEYIIKMWVSEEELVNNLWNNMENSKYSVNISVIVSK